MPLRLTLLITFLLIYCAVTSPAMASTMGEARNLLARTAFGGNSDEIRVLANMEYEAAVKHLLSQSHLQPKTPAPDWINQSPLRGKKRKEPSDAERKALRKELRRIALDLKGWWIKEMVQTDSPITEQMTLFWHTHFTSSLKKVKFPALLYNQNLLLRKHALGNFRQLLHAVAKDPAILDVIDNPEKTQQTTASGTLFWQTL